MATGRPNSIQLWASDLRKTTAFYRDFLGFQLDEPHRHAGNEELHHDLVWGDFADGTAFMLHITQAETCPPTSRAEIGFGVDDLEFVHARAVEIGIPILAEPHAEDWGRNAKYEDPDGNVISLTE